MGMYTELVLKCRIAKTVPDDVKMVINYLFNSGEKPTILPEHAFFKCDRWSHVGKSSSYYHHPQPLNDYHDVDYSNEIYIFSRSDLKNYDDEINSLTGLNLTLTVQVKVISVLVGRGMKKMINQL